MRVVLTRRAQSNLTAIRAYIRKDNPAAATRVAAASATTCHRLQYLPDRGRPGAVAGAREIVAFWPYVIVYQIEGDIVYILRIRHGSQAHE